MVVPLNVQRDTLSAFTLRHIEVIVANFFFSHEWCRQTNNKNPHLIQKIWIIRKKQKQLRCDFFLSMHLRINITPKNLYILNLL